MPRNNWKLLEEFEAEKKAGLDADALSAFMKKRYAEEGEDVIDGSIGPEEDPFIPLPQKQVSPSVEDEEAANQFWDDINRAEIDSKKDGSNDMRSKGKVKFKLTGKKRYTP
jgi:hypothetical protein